MASESLLKQLSQSFYNANGTPNERLDKFCTKDIQRIVIDGNVFTGYKTYSFFWEKFYVKEPIRSSSGVIGNLNSYATVITPHLQIKFALMSMEDYRRLYELILSRNEFTVTCYDPTSKNNSTTTNKMYFYPDSLPKLNMVARQIQNAQNGQKERWIELLGVQDYTIEMVGTNAQLGSVRLTYDVNKPSGVSSSLTNTNIDMAIGQEVVVGNGTSIQNNTFTDINGVKYVFKEWKDAKGTSQPNGTTLFIRENTTLYAQWETTDSYTLSFNYGIGEAEIGSNGEPVNSRTIKYGDNYGTLFQSPVPTVNFNGETISNAYIRKGWYRNSEGLGNAISSTDKYEVYGNTTIYQIFEPNTFTLTFNTNGGTPIPSITNQYKSIIAITTPVLTGKTFEGWYYDDKFTSKFDGKMPPKSLTLYAKWV